MIAVAEEQAVELADSNAAPMTPDDAERVTKRIALRLETIAENTEAVLDLMEQALNREAHRALGYDSWPAYFADRFGDALARLRRAERQPVVAALAQAGMSTRAIASVAGVNQATVVRDLPDEVMHDASPDRAPVTGLDGKTYPRQPVGDTTHLGGDAGAGPPSSKPRRRRRRPPLTDQWRANHRVLTKVVVQYEHHVADDRFPTHRDALATGHAAPLAKLIERLSTVHDRLTDEESDAITREWASRIEHISADIPYDQLTDEQLADALGAAQALLNRLKGEKVTRERKRQ